MKKFGIDISRWQGDFSLTKAKSEGIEFVIIKAGGGDSNLYVDKQFETNYKKAKDLNLPVGCYWFSKALTIADATKEAEYFYNNCIKGKQFELPLYIDVENKEQLAVGKDLLTRIIKTWCEYLEKKDCYVGIYSSVSMFSSYMHDEELQDYDHWIAQWATSCTYKNTYGMWQFGGETNKIRSNMIAGVICDQDYMLIDYPNIIKKAGMNGFKKGQVSTLTESQLRQSVVDTIQGWVGLKESDGSHKKIIDIYNSHKPLARGYTLKYTDAWCAGTVSAVAIVNNITDIMPTEVGVGKMIDLYKSLGRWMETDSYRPQIGDVCMYDWDDNGIGDNVGGGDHVGIVTKVSGNYFWVTEGNYSDSVKTRQMAVDGRYIRGFGLPDYAKKATGKSSTMPTVNTVTTKKETFTMELSILKKGSKGAQVKALQILLNGNGYNSGTPDGDFGVNTDTAVRNYQKAKGLVVDGEAGKATFSSLMGV